MERLRSELAFLEEVIGPIDESQTDTETLGEVFIAPIDAPFVDESIAATAARMQLGEFIDQEKPTEKIEGVFTVTDEAVEKKEKEWLKEPEESEDKYYLQFLEVEKLLKQYNELRKNLQNSRSYLLLNQIEARLVTIADSLPKNLVSREAEGLFALIQSFRLKEYPVNK